MVFFFIPIWIWDNFPDFYDPYDIALRVYSSFWTRHFCIQASVPLFLSVSLALYLHALGFFACPEQFCYRQRVIHQLYPCIHEFCVVLVSFPVGTGNHKISAAHTNSYSPFALQNVWMLAVGLNHISPLLQDLGWRSWPLLGNAMLLGERNLCLDLTHSHFSSYFISLT